MKYIIDMPEGKIPGDCMYCALTDQMPHCDVKHWSDCPLVHAVPYTEQESLAELADRKGYHIIEIHGLANITIATGYTYIGDLEDEVGFGGATHAETESKARAYLSALPDKEGR